MRSLGAPCAILRRRRSHSANTPRAKTVSNQTVLGGARPPGAVRTTASPHRGMETTLLISCDKQTMRARYIATESNFVGCICIYIMFEVGFKPAPHQPTARGTTACAAPSPAPSSPASLCNTAVLHIHTYTHITVMYVGARTYRSAWPRTRALACLGLACQTPRKKKNFHNSLCVAASKISPSDNRVRLDAHGVRVKPD